MTRALALLGALIFCVACAETSDKGVVPGADGTLDCDMFIATDFDPGVDGAQTPFDAMTAWATEAYGDADPQVHVLTSRTGTVVRDGNEVGLISVDELADETFGVVRTELCEDVSS
jgi:hypothetical protein